MSYDHKQIEKKWQQYGTNKSFRAFTTRPDTIYGATYAVLVPEHKLVKENYYPRTKRSCCSLSKKVKLKSDLERTDLADEKMVYSLAHIQLIQSVAKKCQFGLQIMY